MVGFARNVFTGWLARPAALAVGLICCCAGIAVEPAPSAEEGKPLSLPLSHGEREPQAGILARPAAGFDRVTRQTGLGERLIADCRDGRLDEFGLFEAALIASGVDSNAELSEWLGAYRPARAQILSNLPAGTATERLKAIHAAAHRLVLTGYYREAASDLRTALASGDFNCVTALLVCGDLCRGAGLNVQARMLRGHVFLTLETAALNTSAGKVLRIEPGSSQWAVQSYSDGADYRPLTDIELLGKFYYNRGVQRLRVAQYVEGTALLRTSLVLDARDDDARTNLAAGLNNWAVEFCRDKRFDEAAFLIEQGLAIDPQFAPLVANERLVRAKLGK
jgi:tetratricopeptide (TPR) repeat protein